MKTMPWYDCRNNCNRIKIGANQSDRNKSLPAFDVHNATICGVTASRKGWLWLWLAFLVLIWVGVAIGSSNDKEKD
jgi:hypothetical protein